MLRSIPLVLILLTGTTLALAHPVDDLVEPPVVPQADLFLESPVLLPGGLAGMTYPPLLAPALLAGSLETEWRQTVYRANHGRLEPYAALHDGTGLVAAGSTGQPTGWVYKFTEGGEVVYQYHTPTIAAFRDLALTAGGAVLVGGWAFDGEQVTGILQKLDPAGNLLWSTLVPASTGVYGINSIEVQSDGTIVTYGDAGFFPIRATLAPDGALVRVQELTAVSTRDFVLGVSLPDGGSIVQTGRRLARLDADGTQLNQILVPVVAGEARVSDLQLGSDGHVYLSGGTWEYPTPLPWDQHRAFVLKLTTDLEVVWASYLSAADRTAGGGLAFAPDGDIVLVGLAAWNTEYLPNQLVDDRNVGQFVARLAPDGIARFVRVILDEEDPEALVTAYDPALSPDGDDVYALGTRGPSVSSDLYLSKGPSQSALGPLTGPLNTAVNAVHTKVSETAWSLPLWG